ncbi:MAG TPA: response regulator [Sphingomonas sanguinis]|uniref:sigma-54-dependent transcriptional regulator n=1 Tax=Sphingomonas sanguinis TaxID=33051 RepID=UPI002ABF6E77|nr:response regulator [Sphingomonas sanguinis]HJO65719.1 response regulator [Sphingomonas sanguinis]
MSTESPHILVVDDDADIARAAQLLLERQGMTVAHAPDPAAAWVRLAEHPADVILLDLNFARGHTSGEEGFALLDRLVAADRHAVVIVVTGHSGIQVAVQAMRGGAADFIIKPWNNARLTATVERGLALRRAKLATAPSLPGGEAPLLLGDSGAIVAVRDLIARIAPTDAPLLLRGGAGTGKTLAATLAHRSSARAERPLVTLDATGIDADAIPALLAEAVGGTLLIDQVDRLPPALQGALVRGLDQTRDLRLIATSRLDRAGLRERLHEDLLYRINTIECDLPPLAARDGDAVLLARHFAALFAARHGRPLRVLSVEAERSIAADAWPDNIRGLRQATERAVLLGTGERLDVADFALPPDPAQPRALAASLNLARSEETLVAAALQRHGFNVSRAAAELGLTRAALYRRMARYGL